MTTPNRGRQPWDFPESFTHTTGAGPDFPDSAGDREKGKFRPSDTPRLTKVAVAGDDGHPVTRSVEELLSDLLTWQKATVQALLWVADGESFTVSELLDEVRKW